MKAALPNRSIPGGSGGFTLLEVLIALVVLSIGLLGIAALQGVGLRSSQGAYLTSQASLLAYDIADRIRANPQSVAAYNGFVTNCPETMPATPLLDADLAEWSCAVEELLTNGTGGISGFETVVPNIGTITTYTINLEWADLQMLDGDDDGNVDPWTFELTFDL